MGDEDSSLGSTLQPIIHDAVQTEGRLTGALKELYGGVIEAGERGRFRPPRPIRSGGGGVNEMKKEEVQSRSAPIVSSTVTEEDIRAGRFWGYNLRTQTPVLKNADAPLQPPWGNIDLAGILKNNVPVSLVGAAQIYFNAAKYNPERFNGMLTMMDVQDLPKEQFVIFAEESADPLKDGYITMWRIVSKIAYEQYYHLNMAFDLNPDKKKARKTLFETLEACIKGEKKRWGKGRRVPKVKFPKENPEEEEEEEEEPEEEEEEEEDGVGPEGTERLNELMKMHSRGRNTGEWGLGFGFLTESDVFRVYRIWSRPIYHQLPFKVADTTGEDPVW